jgi:hypothetical protein
VIRGPWKTVRRSVGVGGSVWVVIHAEFGVIIDLKREGKSGHGVPCPYGLATRFFFFANA